MVTTCFLFSHNIIIYYVVICIQWYFEWYHFHYLSLIVLIN